MGEYFDKAKGKAKEVAGKVTGNENLEAEGRTDEMKGKAKEKIEDLKHRAKEVTERMKEGVRDTEDELRKQAGTQRDDEDMKKV